jgi:hypothetical protein
MSVVYQWPTAAIKHWIQRIDYVVGVTPDGRTIDPDSQLHTIDIQDGIITSTALFPEPVVEVRGFTRMGSVVTYPVVVIPDYPVMGILLNIRIEP